MKSLVAVIELLDEGSTVPFYRVALPQGDNRQFADEVQHPRDRRAAGAIGSWRSDGAQGDDSRFNPGARQTHRRIESASSATLDKSELEDLYPAVQAEAAHQGGHRARKGLEPLADYLVGSGKPGPIGLETFAATFVNAEKLVANADEALEGARHIVGAERIADSADIRKELRQAMFDEDEA